MSYLMHPWLLVAGIVAVSLPVLIHLLNRRRFRVVDWAAMDFLFEADRQSRRRIRLQHWLLLLLRSLAVLLIGVVLARPFLPSGLTQHLSGNAPVERIIVLDDSLSMQARRGNESAWDAAQRTAVDLIRRLAARGGKDTCTVIVSSRADQPIFHPLPLSAGQAEEMRSRVMELKCGDGPGQLGETFAHLAQALRSQEMELNRALYVFTDMRRIDWQPSEPGGRRDAPGEKFAAALENLRQLSKQMQSCSVIDAADEHDANLTIVEVKSDGPLVSDVRAAINVTLANQGSADVKRIAVRLTIEDGLPAIETVERLAAGDSATVRFHSTVTCIQDPKTEGRIEARRVLVEVKAEKLEDDLLAGDSSFFWPAQIRCGVRALLVDGDPSPEFGKSESFYLERALAPAGSLNSGVVPQVVAENDLDAASLSEYDVVFLLNCGQPGGMRENIERLTQWVARGGSLVILPGDQTDGAQFNRLFWQNGQGLSPVKFEGISGDPGQQSWVELRLEENNRLLPRLADEQLALLPSVKCFRWWRVAAKEDDAEPTSQIVARFTDGDRSPAIAERSWGDGRVVVFAIPADADWHNWSSSPSFVLLAQELVHALVGNKTSRNLLGVGESIHLPLDLARYEQDATLTGPEQSLMRLRGTASIGTGQADSSRWEFSSPRLNQQGFYELAVEERSGRRDKLLYAVNADATEGDLKRIDLATLQRQAQGTNVQFLSLEDFWSVDESGSRAEVWRPVAWLLMAVLVMEQVLGWLFGRERT